MEPKACQYKKNNIIKNSYGKIALMIITVLIYIILKIMRPDSFGTPSTLFSYFQQALLPAVGACGFYFIVVMGLFDFSLGANVILSGIVCAKLCGQLGYAGLIIGALVVGSIIGLCNGVLYIKLKIPSIIITVGLMLIYECIGALIANGLIVSLNNEYAAFGSAPWNILLALVAFILATIFLQYTKVGTYTYAIGSNEVVAKNMGIKVNKYKVIAFVLCGFFAGIMSILTVSYGMSITASSNMSSMDRNFTPIMGCFFGLAFKRSMNPIIAILIGEFIITMILNGLISLGVPTTIQNIVIGTTLIVIILMTTRVKKGAVVK